MLALNGLNAASLGVAVETCDTNPGDVELCHTPPWKLVRVRADLPVYFAFLPIIGWNTVTIHANAIEAASIDIVLTIDTSELQAYDAAATTARMTTNGPRSTSGPAWATAPWTTAAAGTRWSFPDDYMRDPDNCNGVEQCRPFRDVQDVAVSLTTRLPAAAV